MTEIHHMTENLNISEQSPSILVVAGEASGDLHGTGLVRELKSKLPEYRFFGFGGDQMIGEGFEAVFHIRDMSVLGFLEIVKHFPLFRRLFRTVSRLVREEKPEVVIFIDCPGFNLRAAKRIRKYGVPIVYYISPQVWAWGKRRVNTIARLVDRMIVIFPFEEAIYGEVGVDVCFAGHPLKDELHTSLTKIEFFQEIGFDTEQPTVGLLPGSRRQEVQALIPEMVSVVGILREKIPGLQAVVGKAETLDCEDYEPFLEGSDVVLAEDRTRDVMAHSDAVIVASGTATLETALFQTPMVIVYKVSPISFRIGKALVKIKNIGIVNIIAGEEIVPELLQEDARAAKIAEEVEPLLVESQKREEMVEALGKVSHSLGEGGASRRAAEAILDFMNGESSQSV